MPLYPYVCDTCQATSEELESMSAPKQKDCEVENCQGTRHRVLGVGSFHLKGGGWADDGYSASSKD